MSRLIHYLKGTDLAGGIEEQVIWEIPKSALYPEGIKYRLAYIQKGARKPAVLYDNHHPKGHHKHLGDHESPYEFSGVEKLVWDFEKEVEGLRWIH